MVSGEIPYPPQVVHINPVLLAAYEEGSLSDHLMSYVEGLIVAKSQAEEWELNRNLRVARRIEEEECAEKERAEKERVEKDKAEAALKKKEEKKAVEMQKRKAEKEAEEKKRTQAELEKKKKAVLAEQKQAAESIKADKAKSEAGKKAAKEKSPEEQGGNEEVDQEKTEYEKMRDAARVTRREIGLKARNDPAAPSDTEESQDILAPVIPKKVTMTRKEFGLRIKVLTGRSPPSSSSVADPRKKQAIDTPVPDTSTVKLTSLLEEQEQAASSPTVMSEKIAQQEEEGDEVFGQNKEELARPEEPPTSSSLPRTDSVDVSAEEGRTCDFEAEATHDLNVNDAETDVDSPVPTPQVHVKKVVVKNVQGSSSEIAGLHHNLLLAVFKGEKKDFGDYILQTITHASADRPIPSQQQLKQPIRPSDSQYETSSCTDGSLKNLVLKLSKKIDDQQDMLGKHAALLKNQEVLIKKLISREDKTSGMLQDFFAKHFPDVMKPEDSEATPVQ
ncbi:caldesmon-like [Brachypodium distachyon]|uniref:caldesmon-like n=1 Tax=Brachypodium distachyon TaxID=15368 RepID=UPI00052FF304|nr:caldesmon-like [Brachypodium distachyon]|eukprot:XP_010239168.1 caldesmon-like [Brachypodium distachyon]